MEPFCLLLNPIKNISELEISNRINAHENPCTFDKGKIIKRRNDKKRCFILTRMATQSKQITSLMVRCNYQANQVVVNWIGILLFRKFEL